MRSWIDKGLQQNTHHRSVVLSCMAVLAVYSLLRVVTLSLHVLKVCILTEDRDIVDMSSSLLEFTAVGCKS